MAATVRPWGPGTGRRKPGRAKGLKRTDAERLAIAEGMRAHWERQRGLSPDERRARKIGRLERQLAKLRAVQGRVAPDGGHEEDHREPSQ